MANKKMVVVFGVDGKLGGAVAKALASSQEILVRGITLNVLGTTDKDATFEIIPFDLSDRVGLQLSLKDADFCFISTETNFDDPSCLESEINQGCLIADLCKSEKVKHVIFSTQLNSNKICSLMARHLVAKAEIEQYMRDIGLPLTCLIVPVLYEDLFDNLRPKTIYHGHSYSVEIPMGEAPLDMISVEDVGQIVLAVIRQREAYLYKTMSVCGDKITVKEIALILSKYLLPKVFKEKQLTTYDFHQRRSCDMKGSADWANMFQFFQRVDQRYNLSTTKRAHPNLISFEDWVMVNVTRLHSVL